MRRYVPVDALEQLEFALYREEAVAEYAPEDVGGQDAVVNVVDVAKVARDDVRALFDHVLRARLIASW